MCTVSYIPTKEGFYLTSNRDEDPNRKTLPPQTIKVAKNVVLKAPIDEEKGGTWIATNGTTKVACLLNGGFIKHERKTHYTKSRGHFVLESFKDASFLEFIESVSLANIEPFTLILIDDFLQVLVWDGTKKHIQFLSKSIPHLWSSSSLYDQKMHDLKLNMFESFIAEQNVTSNTILNLHDNELFLLKKPQVETVSTTQLFKNAEGLSIDYFNRIDAIKSLGNSLVKK
ncbi:NRDE family protein [Joostella sp.]|uniref:NRDE family protein n=1 Tax=Joostella sp. TaxID=2231138 RepID=UPI003A9425FD